MGQYYKSANLTLGQYVDPYSYSKHCDGFCGAKLMEHSWLRNPFVMSVMFLLRPNNMWHKTAVVWCGDYSNKKDFLLLQQFKGLKEKYAKWYKKAYAKSAEEYPDNLMPNIYDMCIDREEEKKANFGFVKVFIDPPTFKDSMVWHYLVNHTKKVFVDLKKCPSDDGWVVHPLPLLTCDSFGGGGSYHGDNEFAGDWVGDIISCEKVKPKGFVEIKPDFVDY